MARPITLVTQIRSELLNPSLTVNQRIELLKMLAKEEKTLRAQRKARAKTNPPIPRKKRTNLFKRAAEIQKPAEIEDILA